VKVPLADIAIWRTMQSFINHTKLSSCILDCPPNWTLEGHAASQSEELDGGVSGTPLRAPPIHTAVRALVNLVIGGLCPEDLARVAGVAGGGGTAAGAGNAAGAGASAGGGRTLSAVTCSGIGCGGANVPSIVGKPVSGSVHASSPVPVDGSTGAI